MLPAEAAQRAAALTAEGDAAPRREQGAAAAEVIRAMAEAVKAAGPAAREIFVLSQLDELVGQVASKVKEMQVGEVQVIDAGDGKALPALAVGFPQTVISLLGSLKDLTGVDVAAMLNQGGAK